MPDLLAPDQPGWSLAASVVNLAAGYMLVRTLLVNADLMRGGQNGFGSYFVMGIALSLAQGLGLVLLVVPGIFLMVRWLPAYGVLMAEEGGVGDSLARSWQLTSGRFAPLLMVVLMVLAVMVVALAVYASPELGTGVSPTFAVVIGNLLIAVYSTCQTLAGLAAYGVLREGETNVEAVFA